MLKSWKSGELYLFWGLTYPWCLLIHQTQLCSPNEFGASLLSQWADIFEGVDAQAGLARKVAEAAKTYHNSWALWQAIIISLTREWPARQGKSCWNWEENTPEKNIPKCIAYIYSCSMIRSRIGWQQQCLCIITSLCLGTDLCEIDKSINIHKLLSRRLNVNAVVIWTSQDCTRTLQSLLATGRCHADTSSPRTVLGTAGARISHSHLATAQNKTEKGYVSYFGMYWYWFHLHLTMFGDSNGKARVAHLSWRINSGPSPKLCESMVNLIIWFAPSSAPGLNTQSIGFLFTSRPAKECWGNFHLQTMENS